MIDSARTGKTLRLCTRLTNWHLLSRRWGPYRRNACLR